MNEGPYIRTLKAHKRISLKKKEEFIQNITINLNLKYHMQFHQEDKNNLKNI